MLMRKKLLKTIISSLMTVAITALPVCAQTGEQQENDSEIVYENELGARLTASGYNKMLEYMSEEDLSIFTQKDFDYMVEHIDEDGVQTDEKYVRTTYEEGKPVVDEYITEEEMLEDVNVVNKPLNAISTYGMSIEDTDYKQTDMKKITMTGYMVDATVKEVTLECKWIKLPSVRSYDILAFRPSKTSYISAGVDSSTLYGIQHWSSTQSDIKYPASSSNVKFTDGGVGVSMNLVDDATELYLKAGARFAVSAGSNSDDKGFVVFGTYQHATKDVSLSDSQKYNISSAGMGGVLKFKNNKEYYSYDNTPGLSVTLKLEIN